MENDALKKKDKFNEKVKSEFANNVRLHNEKQQQQQKQPKKQGTKRKRSTATNPRQPKVALRQANSSTSQLLEPPRPLSRMSLNSGSEDSVSVSSDVDRPIDEFDDMEIPDLDFSEYLTSTDISKDIPDINDINVQDIVDELSSDDPMETTSSISTASVAPELSLIHI